MQGPRVHQHDVARLADHLDDAQRNALEQRGLVHEALDPVFGLARGPQLPHPRHVAAQRLYAERNLPKLEVVGVDASHAVNAERPDEFNTAATSFLAAQST